MKEVIVLEGNRKRVKVEATCQQCDQQFLVRKGWSERQKFCSTKCSTLNKSLNNSKEVCCAFCGEIFRKVNSDLNSKSGLYFCNRKHKDLAQRLGGIAEIQPAHYGTGTGIYSYRKLAFDNLPKECKNCGYKEHKSVLIVHHVDRDRDNNDLTNLEILCPTCHAVEHFLAKDGLWKNSK